MSLSISNKLITNIDDCIGKPLLTYVFYPSDESTRCFAYPQFLYDDDKNEIVSISSKDAFPEEGGLSIGIVPKISITNCGQLQNKYGDIVLMTINEVPMQNNNYGKDYGKGKDEHKYHTSILPGIVKGSYVHFETISRHSLSFQLFQVLNVEERLNFSKSGELWSAHMYEGDVLPLTNLVLLEQESEAKQKFIGPFRCSNVAETSQEIKLQAYATEPYSYYIAPINSGSVKRKLEITSEHGDVIAKFVLADEFQLLFEGSKQIDCVSNEDLVNAIGKIPEVVDDFSKKQMRKLKQAIRTCQDVQASIQLTDARRKHMECLLNTLEYWQKLPSETQSIAFKNAKPEELAGFVLNNPEAFAEFYEKAAQVRGIREELYLKEGEAHRRIDKAKEAIKKADEEKEQALRELKNIKQKANEERKKIKAEIEEQNKAATQEKKQLEHDIEKLTSNKQKLESDNALIEKQINSKINDMSDELFVSDKIIESELIKKLVSTLSDNNSISNTTALGNKTASTTLDVNNSISEKELIKQLCANISELGGRDLELNDVVNLMICLTQGYILTLAGLPGTGKTSLVSILAGCLGLQNCKRIAEVSVERGWTSYKDFIGYYNPLTKTMEKSNSDVFDAFEMLNGEVAANVKLSETAPYFVLLDEANLSSIEHYWSPFLKECDSFQNRNTSISLGGATSMSLPSYLRFIATVNFDHTTEELSPRFLDRSWVITLQANELDFQFDSAASNEPDYEKVPVYSVEKLQKVFGTSKNEKISNKLDEKYHTLLSTCENHSLPISPRSQKMMYNFVSTAQRLMSCSSKDTEYAPVDYAFAQKVLPQISGTEEQVEGLLEDLKALSGLPITKERVNHMLKAGHESGYYQYFS